MPQSRKRKSVLLPKQQHIKVRKRTTKAQRTQASKHTPYVILDTGKYRKRIGVKQQAYERSLSRKANKAKYRKQLASDRKYKRLHDYIKQYKAATAKQATKRMVAAMKKRGYFWFEIEWAKKYSIPGKYVQTAIAKVEKYIGKKVNKKKQNQMYKRAIKAARIKSYMDILGIGIKKAREIYKIFEDHLPGEFELKALIY